MSSRDTSSKYFLSFNFSTLLRVNTRMWSQNSRVAYNFDDITFVALRGSEIGTKSEGFGSNTIGGRGGFFLGKEEEDKEVEEETVCIPVINIFFSFKCRNLLRRNSPIGSLVILSLSSRERMCC